MQTAEEGFDQHFASPQFTGDDQHSSENMPSLRTLIPGTPHWPLPQRTNNTYHTGTICTYVDLRQLFLSFRMLKIFSKRVKFVNNSGDSSSLKILQWIECIGSRITGNKPPIACVRHWPDSIVPSPSMLGCVSSGSAWLWLGSAQLWQLPQDSFSIRGLLT